MRNILYLTDHKLNDNSGVSQKVMEQCRIWTDLGYKVEIRPIAASDTSPSPLHTFINLMQASRKTWLEVKDSSYDLLYTRTFLWTPWLHILFKRFPTVLEVNGHLSLELRRRSKLTWLYAITTHHFLLKNVRAIVCVSNELASLYKSSGKKTFVIANGGPTEKSITETTALRPQVGFIGTNQPWHGLDKFQQLVRALPDFDFHLIGFSQCEAQKNLFQYGTLSNSDAIAILNKCHVGISSLALHRAGITEASPLKSREYMSLGLACLIAHNDTDLNSDLDFVLKINNTESNINESITLISKFINRTFRDPSSKQRVINYYKSNLSWKVKEKARLSIFESVLKGKS